MGGLGGGGGGGGVIIRPCILIKETQFLHSNFDVERRPTVNNSIPSSQMYESKDCIIYCQKPVASITTHFPPFLQLLSSSPISSGFRGY